MFELCNMILWTGESMQAQEMITGWVHCGASAFTTSACMM